MLTHDLKSIADYARKVEALGYDCLWSAETQHDPFLPLAVAATVTSTIKLGTSIAVAARARAAGRRGGHGEGRTPARRLHLRDVELRGGRRHRAGDRAAEAGGEAADRLLRLHAHLRARAGRARLAGPGAATAPQVGGRRLEGHGRSHHGRDARDVRRRRLLRQHRDATQGALRGVARPHGVLPARKATETRRPPVAQSDSGLQRVKALLFREFGGPDKLEYADVPDPAI